ncbi:MAG: hypothetical protein HZB85_03760 [Deltaproteobacteria bacterium]|nr:hypothetical protein [Deltaproteobacteria bacterium]
MQLKRYELGARRSGIFAIASVVITLALLSVPARAFISDYRYGSVQTILDDADTEALDAVSISTKSIPAFMAAVEQLKAASAMEPSRALYHKARGDIYFKLGNWAQAMRLADAELPPGALQAEEAFESASAEFRRAIELEPLDPHNHLAMGMLLDAAAAVPELSEKEYGKAADAFPVNAPIRYAIAQQYLLTGRTGNALEQARILAALDDTYKLPSGTDKKMTIERMDRRYQTQLSRSYLFHALEIAWRVSKDPQVVKGITPDNDEAREVLALFFEWNDIDG